MKQALKCRDCGVEATSDGTNWGETEINERSHVVCVGEDCGACKDFAATTPHNTVDALLKWKKDHPKQAKEYDNDKAEFMRNREDPLAADHEEAGIEYLVISGSRLEERYPF